MSRFQTWGELYHEEFYHDWPGFDRYDSPWFFSCQSDRLYRSERDRNRTSRGQVSQSWDPRSLAGTEIIREMGQDHTKAALQYTGQYPSISGNSVVVTGTGSKNRVSYALDTPDFKPGAYNISCLINKGR